jgi:hypothetical protein
MEHCLYLLLSQSLKDMVVVTVVAVTVVTVVTVVPMVSVMTMMVPMALLHNDHLRLRLNYHLLRRVSGLWRLNVDFRLAAAGMWADRRCSILVQPCSCVHRGRLRQQQVGRSRAKEKSEQGRNKRTNRTP